MAARLTRTVLGRQAAYARYSDLTTYRGLDVFDTQDWESNNPTAVFDTATIPQLRGSLRLALSSSGSYSNYTVEAAIADVADAYLQMEIADMESGSPSSYTPTTGDFRAGLAVRGNTPVSNTFPTDAIFIIVPGPTSSTTSPNNRAEISERVANVFGQTIRTASDVRGSTSNRRIHAVVSGTSVEANNGGVGTTWALSGTGFVPATGRIGFFGANTFASQRLLFVAGYYRCSGKDLIVNGPTDATWYVELLDKDDNVLHTSSVQSGGQVVVDYHATNLLLPLTQKIRITDGVSPLVTVYPDNGVWPGDTWTYADDPAPSGVVTRTAAGFIMARLSSYITTGLSISPNAVADWAAWSSSGATNIVSFAVQTNAGASYPNDFRVGTTLTGTTRRGVRWIGSESMLSDSFMVATARYGVSNVSVGSTNNGLFLRSGTAPQTARVGGVLAGANSSPQEHQLEEHVAGTTVQTSVESGATAVNRRNRFALWVRGTVATFRAIVVRQVSGPDVISETLTGLTSPAPTAGMALNMGSPSTAIDSWWNGMAVMTSAEITMSGPATGVAAWGLRVRDASGMVIAESGVNVAGVATVDTQVIMDAAYGRYSISTMRAVEAYDTATGDTLSDVLVPSGGVWGGDTFTVASLPPAGDDNRARLTHRKAGAARLLFRQ
jgi:hypothetical protein